MDRPSDLVDDEVTVSALRAKHASDDIEELQAAATEIGWNIRYTQVEAGKLGAGWVVRALPGMVVTRERMQGGFLVCGDKPVDFTSIHIPVSAGDADRLNAVPYAAGDILIPGEATELAFASPQGAVMITLQLYPEALRDLDAMLGSYNGTNVLRSGQLSRHAASARSKAFQYFLASLLQDEDCQTPARAETAMAGSILEHLTALLEAVEPDTMTSRPGPLPDRRVRCARLARAYLEANLDRRVSIPELCWVTGERSRTLLYAFSDHFAMPPGRYHKLRRLKAARQALQIAGPGEQTVTQTAMDFGFWHFGRFSLEFQAQFGQRPSETLAQRPHRVYVPRRNRQGSGD